MPPQDGAHVKDTNLGSMQIMIYESEASWVGQKHITASVVVVATVMATTAVEEKATVIEKVIAML